MPLRQRLVFLDRHEVHRSHPIETLANLRHFRLTCFLVVVVSADFLFRQRREGHVIFAHDALAEKLQLVLVMAQVDFNLMHPILRIADVLAQRFERFLHSVGFVEQGLPLVLGLDHFLPRLFLCLGQRLRMGDLLLDVFVELRALRAELVDGLPASLRLRPRGVQFTLKTLVIPLRFLDRTGELRNVDAKIRQRRRDFRMISPGVRRRILRFGHLPLNRFTFVLDGFRHLQAFTPLRFEFLPPVSQDIPVRSEFGPRLRKPFDLGGQAVGFRHSGGFISP